MSQWNKIDKFIAQIRYRKLDKYVGNDNVICGIGCGQNADFLKRHIGHMKKGYGFGFRIDDESVNNLKLINNKQMCQFTLEDSSCDVVFMIALLEHLDELYEMLKEIYRILKDDVMLVLTTPTRLAKPILEFTAFKMHIINEDEILEHKHYYTKKEIFQLFEQSSFVNHEYRKFCLGVNSMAVAKKGL